MEIVGKTVRDRVVQAFAVFIVLLAFDYFLNEIEWFGLLVSASLFFVLMIGFDAIRQKFEEQVFCVKFAPLRNGYFTKPLSNETPEKLLQFFDERGHRLVNKITVKTALPEVDILLVNRLDSPWNDPTSSGVPPRIRVVSGISIKPFIQDFDVSVRAIYCSP